MLELDNTELLCINPLPVCEQPSFDSLSSLQKEDIYLDCINGRTEYASDVLTYISGAVHRKLKSSEPCLECGNYLNNVLIRDTSKFINFINRGGLVHPCSNINVIVKITETCLNCKQVP